MTSETRHPDPRLSRSLWQLFALAALALACLPPLRAASLAMGSPLWLAVLPLVALATLHRHALAAVGARVFAPARRRRPTVAAALAAPDLRVSVRVPSRGARNAPNRVPVPGRRVARLSRSTRNEHRSQPVAGRR